MENSGNFKETWSKFSAKVSPVLKKTGAVLSRVGLWIYRLRQVFLAIPVVWGALKLAARNMERLPEQVGLNLLPSGAFSQLVSRDYAVYGPLAVTALCLLLMFFSRKPLYPWLVSVFSLVLPLLIYLTNCYPA